VIASGVNYRRLAVENLDAYEGASVHYWATRIEARLCVDQEVVLVGGGNSAGQAVVFLYEHVAKVWMLVRGADLASTMSRYLVDWVSGLANVQVLTRTQITALEGTEGVLSAVQWHRGTTGEMVRRPIRHLFLFIGADPNTGWLSGSGVALDPKRFVLTGTEAGEHRRPLETSRRGVFAIGDIRSGSVKRVAAAHLFPNAPGVLPHQPLRLRARWLGLWRGRWPQHVRVARRPDAQRCFSANASSWT
jgi:thioredoxin reductase (NADPH)